MAQSGPWERYASAPQPVAPPAPRPRPTSPRYTGPLPATAEELFPALVQQESGGRAGAVGPETRWGRALGRTQMLPATAREVSGRLGLPYREDLLRGTSAEAAAYQDRLGRAYLQEGFERTGNARDALHYYHGGPDRRLWGPKTRAYADSILAMTAQGGAPQPQPEQSAAPWARYAAVTQEQAGLSDADLEAVAARYGGDVAGEPVEVEIAGGVRNVNGRAIIVEPDGSERDAGPWEQYWGSQRKSAEERAILAERRDDPEYQAEYEAAYARSEGVPAWLENLTQGGTLGAVPYIEGAVAWLNPNLEGIDRGKASQAARDASRDRQEALLREDLTGTVGMQLLGGLATPGLKGSGDWIAGARGAERIGRAAAVSGGYGAASGLLSAEGDLADRLGATATGAAVGAGSGGLLDAGAQRAFASTARAAAKPSNARLLSREGVDLTPGQMVAEVPVIGPLARNLEEGASSIPFVGAPIAGARQQSVETFNRAAVNRALEPLGRSLPKGMQPGYAAVEEAQVIVGRAYDDVLQRTTFVPDRAFYDDIGKQISGVLTDAGVPQSRTLARQINDRVFRTLEAFDDPISGEQFKRLESEFGNLARQNLEAADGASRALGRAYQAVQEALRDGLRRQNPEAASDLKAANSAYARLMRVERAAGSTASQANDGVFTPTQLGQAVGQMGSRRASARGDALLQDLAVAGRSIIPSRVGDSGTATRGAITGLLAAGASGTPIGATLAAPVLATSIAYSKPAQALLNTIYRATDRQTAFSALGELQRFAGRNPALQPFYQAALEAALRAFQPQSPETGPAATGLLSTTPPVPAAP